MSLGDQLRTAIETLRHATFSDQSQIKESVKQIQRALISSDVEITLVLELSKRIEKAAFSELPPGLNRREHVIKETHDALVELLGGTGQLAPEHPKRILLVGLFGSGKCVHPSTLVPLADGTNKTIEEIYNRNAETELVLEDGFAKELSKPFEVFSLDPTNLKMVRGKATHLWKLKKDKPLYKVSLDNGNNHSVIVTSEHPFFVLENAEIKKTRADEIRVGSFVATPRKIPLQQTNSISLDISNTTIFPTVQILNHTIAESAKTFMQQKFGTLTQAYEKLNEPIAYCTFTAALKKGNIRGSTLQKINAFGYEIPPQPITRIKSSNSNARAISIPFQLTPELSEFLGYFLADGHMRKNYLEIVNESDEIIQRIRELGQALFGVMPHITNDKRRQNLRKVIFCSTLLTKWFNSMLDAPFNKKSAIIRIPKQILNSGDAYKAAFLQAYFDCDGHVASNTRQIEFCTASRIFADDLRLLLYNFGMVPNHSKRMIQNRPYYRVCIKAKDVELFAQKIGSRIPFKKERLSKCRAMGEGQTFGKNEMLSIGNKLLETRSFFGATIGEIQHHVSSYGMYEKDGNISRESLRKFIGALSKTKNKNNELLQRVLFSKDIRELTKEMNESGGWTNASIFRLKELGLVEYSNGQIQTTEKGKQLLESNNTLQEKNIQKLKLLCQSDIAWMKVKKIELVENTEFVYDLTVEDYHNFVANHIIVHNTTTVGKLAHYYQKRGKKVGIIAADTFRPAALEQLQQIAKKINVPVFGNNSEKNAKKVVQEAMKQAHGFDLLICDSAGRNALDDELQREIVDIKNVFLPEQSWLVLGADMGQLASKQSQAFHELVGVNGIIITRMDGSAKGGGALAACHHTKAPVFFIGTGEKTDDLEAFDPTRFLSRLLGYGDLQALLEKAKEAQEELEMNPEELLKGNFSLEMFYQQLAATKKMGSLDKVLEMVGMKQNMNKDAIDTSQAKLDSYKVIMDSMTKKEKTEPDLINSSRIARIAKGSGTTQENVRELLKHFKKMQKAFKQFKNIKEEDLQKGGIEKLQRAFAKKKKFKVR